MRWSAFFILAYVVLAVQLGLSGYANWGRVVPNLVLPAVVFLSVHARREPALAGAMALGLLQDLFGPGPLGLYAFCYALVGLFVAGTSASMHRDHPLAHLALTLGAGLLTNAVVCVHAWVYPKLHAGSAGAVEPMGPWPAVAGALYTALLAVPMLMLLSRARRLFGFRGRAGSAARAAQMMR